MKVVFLTAFILILSGCADHMALEQFSEAEEAVFLHGLWHGATIPFSLVFSFFMDDVTMYATYNDGTWYFFGYIIGSGAFIKFLSINFLHFISVRFKL